MQIAKSKFSLGVMVVLAIVFYAHWSIGDEIAESLIYIWYAFLALIVIGAILIAAYAIRVLMTKWQLQIAQAQMAIAESQKASRDIREFGNQIYHFGVSKNEITHALHLDPRTYSNGGYEKPSEQQMAIFNMVNQTFNQQNNYYGNEDDEPAFDGVSLLESGIIDNDNWIGRQLLTAPHIHICGPTTSGKTALGKFIIEKMQSASNGSEFWLINPKHVAYKEQWPLKPFIDNIDDALDGLRKLATMLKDRVADKNYHPATYKNVVVIIDEWDWIYEHHRNNAVSALRQLIKVGAELNYKILLLGQSPLSQDTGLSGSDYHNMARVAIWAAADKLIVGLTMNAKDKAPLKSQIAELKRHPDNIRYALVVPLNEQPAVKIIPNLGVLDLIIEQPDLTMDLTTDQRELTAIEMLKDGNSLRKTAEFLTGKDDKIIGSSDTDKVKLIAQKYGLKLKVAQRKRTELSSL